ncbi:MAG: hypothetical protein PUB20_07065 [Clostridia bacterium]|nr:hypothetical protein [Clostridia bacterium]
MENLNDILSSLTPDDIESLKATAEAIFGSSGSPTAKNNTSGSSKPNDANNSVSGSSNAGFDIGNMLNPEMFAKIAEIMSVMNSDGGKRCRLLEALKPNLSPDKQKKTDDAIQLIKLLEIMPILEKSVKKGDKNAGSGLQPNAGQSNKPRP